jgi:hypothetical protein
MIKTLLKYYTDCSEEQGILKTPGNHTQLFISGTSFNFFSHNIGFIFCYNQISSTFPDDFQLFQNCPNPYNSTTNIRFQFAKSGTIDIELYDILGRDVKEFVNEYKPSGTYEISFDASRFSSGVFFTG